MSSTTHMLRGLLERGWTQSEITRRTGIPQPRLSKWSRGMVPSGADDALKLKELHDEAVGVPGAVGMHAATVTQPLTPSIAGQNIGEKF